MNLIDGNKIVVIKDRAFTLKTISDIYVFDNMLYVHCFNGDIAKIKLDKVSDFRLFKDVVDEFSVDCSNISINNHNNKLGRPYERYIQLIKGSKLEWNSK